MARSSVDLAGTSRRSASWIVPACKAGRKSVTDPVRRRSPRHENKFQRRIAPSAPPLGLGISGVMPNMLPGSSLIAVDLDPVPSAASVPWSRTHLNGRDW